MAPRQPAPFAPPQVRLSLAVTGHRAGHPHFAENQPRIAAALEQVLDTVDAAMQDAPTATALAPFAPIRLHTLLADGTDRLAASSALRRGYELVAPLPFGRRLNRAINSLTEDPAEARELLAGGEGRDAETQSHAAAIRELTDQARVFSLADGDEMIARLFLAQLDAPGDRKAAQLFAAECSQRVAQAGRILIEQSDLLVAVWDGVSLAHVGGTGETLARALECGVPVLWIDPARPEDWRVLQTPEQLELPAEGVSPTDRIGELRRLVHAILDPRSPPDCPGFSALDREAWRPRSNSLAHGYRLVETLFGGDRSRGWLAGLRQTYHRPDESGDGLPDLPGGDGNLALRIERDVQRRFHWLDAISARLSDAYRGGMTVNFMLSSLAIVGGISYLPFAEAVPKWIFATIELVLLAAVLAITITGQRRRFHQRWFEARRAAEYLRHAPLLLALGAARAAGRWPRSAEAGWPEFYARQVMRQAGLPRLALSQDYLHAFLSGPLADHVRDQRDYHLTKARRLDNVHRRLDHLSERLFQFAVLSVALYLSLSIGAAIGLVAAEPLHAASKYFTVLGVAFPTFGAGIAGLRYFGDFERFSEISQVSGERLGELHDRIAMLVKAPVSALRYGQVADLVHAVDDAVVAELESWQAVFGGKKMSVPV
jgi:hypothetical protein